MKKLILLLSLPGAVFANDGVQNDLDNFFNQSGFVSNVTTPTAYQGQEAGYYSAGSLYLQSPSRYVQPIGITLPSLNTGCGGIDLFNGGMSFINSKELTAFAQNVMSNAAGYALHLALATYAPEIDSALKYIQDVAQQINQFGMSSCQAAQALVGGIWDMTGQNMTQACQDMGQNQNAFGNWVSAKEGCTTGNQSSSIFQNGQSQGQGKDQLLPNTNIAWNALGNYGITSENEELAEFLMTVSGTIVTDSKGNPHFYPPQFNNGNIIDALINGGTADIYTCSESSSCLNITSTTMNIGTQNGLVSLARNNVSTIARDLASDTPLNSSLQSFLQNVNFPILTILESTAMTGQNSASITEALSEYLAYYILDEYLQWALNTVDSASSSLNIPAPVLSEFTNNISQGQAYIEADVSNKAQQYLTQLQGLMANNQMMQQAIGKSSTAQVENVEFQNGE